MGELWTPMKGFHPERRKAARPAPRLRDATQTRAGRALRAVVLNTLAHEEFRAMVGELSKLAEEYGDR